MGWWQREEIDRLSRKQADDGLSQEERYMLDKMRTSLQHHDAFTAKQEDANSKVAAVVQKLESGAHVRPKEEEMEIEQTRIERRELEALVADSADAAEAGLLYRWVSNGVAPLDQQERRQLALLVRRVAALGRLDSAEHREKFAAHGLGAAFRLEEEGNTLFKSAQVDEAFDKYHEVVQSVKGILAVPALGRPDMVDLKKKVDLMHLAVNLNLAACSLKEKRHEEAMEYCREVLTVDDRNVKALFRRAQALSQLSRSGEAIEVLNKARKLDPQNRDLEVLLKQITSEERKRVEQEKKRFGGMFEW
eukprot:gene22375-26996_t